MTARMTKPASEIARVPYVSAHSRDELHAMLDTLIDSGRQWLVEMHFAAWTSRHRQMQLSKANRPRESAGSVETFREGIFGWNWRPVVDDFRNWAMLAA